MGLVYTRIHLANPRHNAPSDLEVRAMVDSGADVMCLPPDVVAQLGLEANTTRMATMADGERRRCRYVGPVRVRFEDRECYVGALEMGDEVLLGAIAMEDMDLTINPRLRMVTANPEHPEGPQNTVKGFATF